MNWRQMLTAPGRAAGRGLKALSMTWSGRATGWWPFMLLRTKFDYAKEVGDGSRSSIVVAVVNWMARTFPEAPVMVADANPDGTFERIPEHELVGLLERPNGAYSGVLLWMATIVDWVMSGNAYWLKVRSDSGSVVELWWAPSSTMEPKWPDDGKTFISHYDYKPDKARSAVRIDPRDCVHFRYGMDPENPRKGLSQMRTLLREIFTDEEAANMTASLMRNMGVPGVVISPDSDKVKVAPEDLEKGKQDFMEKFGGDRKGEPMMLSAPTKVSVLSFSPEQMLLRELRRVPEERVTAVVGVAAVVVGLGAGLDRSTFTNFHEAREAAYENNVIPTQRLMAADIQIQLLPDFDENPKRRVRFDNSQVRVLQPDIDKLYTRVNTAVAGGWMTVGAALKEIGKPSGPEHDIYLRPLHISEVPADRVVSDVPSPEDFRQRIDALSILVRSGFDPEESAQQLGLPAIPHLGLLPVTVQAADGGGTVNGNGKAWKAMALPQRLSLVRARIGERFEPELRMFFEDQSKRVLSVIGGVTGQKAAFAVGQVMPAGEDELLAKALAGLWLIGLELGWQAAAETFSIDGTFSAEGPMAAAALESGAVRARRINDRTRESIAETLAIAEVRGYTLQQAIDGVGEDGFRGIRERVEEEYANRALTVARTEAMWSTNAGTTGAYEAAGYQRVQMIDSTDHEPCASRNGRVVSIEAGMAAADREHPNGTLSFVPA